MSTEVVFGVPRRVNATMFGIYEFFTYLLHGATWQMRLPAVLMHAVTGHVPLGWAFALHVVFNAIGTIAYAPIQIDMASRSILMQPMGMLPLYSTASVAGLFWLTSQKASNPFALNLWVNREVTPCPEPRHAEVVLPGECLFAPDKFVCVAELPANLDSSDGLENVSVKRIVEPRKRKPRLRLLGIAFDDIVPSYYASTPEAELKALRQRLLISRPTVDPYDWQELVLRADANMLISGFTEVGPIRYRGRVCFSKWVGRYQKAAQRKLLTDTWLNDDGRSLTRDDNTRSSFIKTELRPEWRLHFWAIKLGIPRSIISSKPIRLVRLGPFMHALGLAMQQYFAPTCPILVGMTNAEGIGSWFDNMCMRFGPYPMFLLSDLVRQDAHFHYFAIQRETAFCEMMGMAHKALEAMKDGWVFSGMTRHGISFSAIFRRASGDPHTLVLNTKLNMELNEFAISPHSLGVDAACALLGDDNLTILPYDTKLTSGLVQARTLRVGFPSEVVLTPRVCEVTFCSKLMYPSADGTVPAPPLGRLFYKFGWHLDKPNYDYRSVVKQTLDDMWHVPFARDYLLKVLSLLPVTKIKKVVGEEYRIHVARRHEQHPSIWVFLMERYGLTRSHHERFQLQLEAIDSLPVIVHVPWMHDLVQMDLY